jgi:hypothetical protein
MAGDVDPVEALAAAVYRAYNPDPVEALAAAVSAAFAARPAPVVAEQDRQLARADLVTRHRELQARSAAKYGPPEALFDRLQARGRYGLSGQVWC